MAEVLRFRRGMRLWRGSDVGREDTVSSEGPLLTPAMVDPSHISVAQLPQYPQSGSRELLPPKVEWPSDNGMPERRSSLAFASQSLPKNDLLPRVLMYTGPQREVGTILHLPPRPLPESFSPPEGIGRQLSVLPASMFGAI